VAGRMRIRDKPVAANEQTVGTEYIPRMNFSGMEVLYSTPYIDGRMCVGWMGVEVVRRMQIAKKLVAANKETVRTEYMRKMEFRGMTILFSTL
jgi:hypothetical protein